LQVGQSALHFAALTGQTNAARVLLDAGIPVDALSLVCDGGHDHSASPCNTTDLIAVDSTQVKQTPLQLASGEGHFAVTQLLLAAGAAVDHHDAVR
jgi:ankyrin repeat protein